MFKGECHTILIVLVFSVRLILSTMKLQYDSMFGVGLMMRMKSQPTETNDHHLETLL